MYTNEYTITDFPLIITYLLLSGGARGELVIVTGIGHGVQPWVNSRTD